jgi:hypothetical protein
MPTIQQLVDKYKNYSDEDLFEVYSMISEYSEEAKEALEIVLNNKGGIDKLRERIEDRHKIEDEFSRLTDQTYELISLGLNDNDIKQELIYTFHTPDQIDDLIISTRNKFNQEVSNQKIKPRTVFGGLVGGAIGGIIGGIIWGMHLVYAERIILFLSVVPIVINYSLIKFFTKQSWKNIAVLLITILASIFAFLLGNIIFDFVGLKEK